MGAHSMTVEAQVQISVGAKTEQGKREENQDNMTGFTSPFGSVYVVADGMGGHRGGAEASRIVVESFRKYLSSASENMPLAEALQQATNSTNAEVYRRGQTGDQAVAGMGSTVVLAVVRNTPAGSELVVGHVGDSRAYLFRHGELRRLTRDHSAVQRLVDMQIVTPDQARSHPDASVLTRALGQQPEVTMDVMSPELLQADDVVLLCSDGLHGYVNDDPIRAELESPRPPAEIARSLVQLALRSGSDDNITVQVLRAADPAVANRRSKTGMVAGSTTGERRAVPSPAQNQLLTHLGAAILGIILGVVGTLTWMHFWGPKPVDPGKKVVVQTGDQQNPPKKQENKGPESEKNSVEKPRKSNDASSQRDTGGEDTHSGANGTQQGTPGKDKKPKHSSGHSQDATQNSDHPQDQQDPKDIEEQLR